MPVHSPGTVSYTHLDVYKRQKQYNGEDGQAVTALDHIDLHIKDGEFVCIAVSYTHLQPEPGVPEQPSARQYH